MSNNNLVSIIFPDVKLKNVKIYNNNLPLGYKKCYGATKCNFGKLIIVKEEKGEKYYNVEKGTLINRFIEAKYVEDDVIVSVENIDNISSNKTLVIIVITMLIINFVLVILNLLKYAKYKQNK